MYRCLTVTLTLSDYTALYGADGAAHTAKIFAIFFRRLTSFPKVWMFVYEIVKVRTRNAYKMCFDVKIKRKNKKNGKRF
jgi:hypothetical protein